MSFTSLLFSQKTFHSGSQLWTNNRMYNVRKGLKSFNDYEAKFPAFNQLSFEDIYIGMIGTSENWLKIYGVKIVTPFSLCSKGRNENKCWRK